MPSYKVIEAAAKSPLGLAALVLLLIGMLVLGLFRQTDIRIRFRVFLIALSAFMVVFVFAVFNTKRSQATDLPQNDLAQSVKPLSPHTTPEPKPVGVVEKRKPTDKRTSIPPTWKKEWSGNDSNTQVAHRIGHPEANKWAVNPDDKEGEMLYGPYTPLGGGVGTYSAFWIVKLNEPCSSEDAVLQFNVHDYEENLVVAHSKEYHVSDWSTFKEYIEARVEFRPKPRTLNHRYEFRARWKGHCGVTLERFGVEKLENSSVTASNN